MTDSAGSSARRGPFFSDGGSEGKVRRILLERRSSPRAASGGGIASRRLPLEDLAGRLERNRGLLGAARPHLERAAGALAGVPWVLYLVDREGIVLWSSGPSAETLEESGALPGVDWSERAAGLNAAGNALQENETVFAAGSSRGSPSWRRYSALAVPIRGPGGD